MTECTTIKNDSMRASIMRHTMLWRRQHDRRAPIGSVLTYTLRTPMYHVSARPLGEGPGARGYRNRYKSWGWRAK